MSAHTLDSVVRPRHSLSEYSHGFTTAEAQDLLRTRLAPWVQELNLVVEQCSSLGARLRLPYSPKLLRWGNTVCGQTLMACADTAMALAIFGALGRYRNITTLNQTMNFMRVIANADVLIYASVRKLGKNIVFGEVALSASGADTIAAHASATWALLPE